MHLLRVGEPGQERPCAVTADGRALDVSPYVSDFDPRFFAQGGIDMVRSLLETHTSLPVVDLAGKRIGPPIARPSKVICVGLNYRDHASEAGMPIPTEPVIFFKSPNTIVGPYDDVRIPRGSMKTDWEVELAVVIGAGTMGGGIAALAASAGYGGGLAGTAGPAHTFAIVAIIVHDTLQLGFAPCS